MDDTDNFYRNRATPMRRKSYAPPPRPEPTPANPVTVGLRRAEADTETVWHSHDWVQLAYPLSGTIRVATPDTAWIVPPYRAIWIPGGIPHQITMLSPVTLRTVYVDNATAPLPLDACRVVDVSPLLGALFDALAEEPPPDESRRGLVLGLLADEIRRAPALSLGLSLPRDRRLRSLCEALLDDPASNLTLAGWAPRVGASERTLARLFRDELGTSFGAWRQQLRLSRAATLVAQGRPLAAVAAELGYASPSAFGAMFRRALGVPPSRFFRRE